MAESDNNFLNQLTQKIGELAVAKAGKKTGSRQLTNAMRFVREAADRGYVYVPHYWAHYVHDGRRKFRLPEGNKAMVWFRDKNADPRLENGDSPERPMSVPSLLTLITREEFLDLKRTGQIVIRREIFKDTDPKPFFSVTSEKGMKGFSGEVTDRLGDLILTHIRRRLDPATRQLSKTLVFRF